MHYIQLSASAKCRTQRLFSSIYVCQSAVNASRWLAVSSPTIRFCATFIYLCYSCASTSMPQCTWCSCARSYVRCARSSPTLLFLHHRRRGHHTVFGLTAPRDTSCSTTRYTILQYEYISIYMRMTASTALKHLPYHNIKT